MKQIIKRLHKREDFERLVLELLNPLKPYYSQEGAWLKLGSTAAVYDQDAALAEGFLRPLWGLVPLWAGGSEESEFKKIYQKGLAAGTNPDGAEYWGGFQDVDQRFVEMAAISYGILMSPEVVWEPLSEQEQSNLAGWLDGINHYQCPPCNWMFFGILVNIALKSQGRPYNEERLIEYLDYIESCYQGEGWYIDGQNGEKDYYVSFAFHYYGLIYARYMNAEDPKRCRVYEQRAFSFAGEFLYWFAEDGSALAYGRSLTYRLAQVSFFSMCVANELEVLPLPVMKGLIVRHLQFWLKQPIFDNAGILTIGYGYSNLLMSEQYNAPGSPYWCMKAFALLSLPAAHPFWEMEAAPLPEMDGLRVISNGSMLVQRLGGEVSAYVRGRSLPHHHVHMEEKYSKFVYSSKFAFSVPRSLRTLEEAAPDSVLAVEHGGMIHTKGITGRSYIENNEIHMEWSPCEGVDIVTRIVLLPKGHRRIHTINSRFPCKAFDCGFAIPCNKETRKELLENEGVVSVYNGRTGYQARCVGEKGKGFLIHAAPNTNLMDPKTVIPSVVYEISEGTQTIMTEFLEVSDESVV